MYTLYVLQHTVSRKLYIGKTSNLQRRMRQHNKNQQTATRHKNGEWMLVYAEAYRVKADLDARELKLKQHGSNLRWLKDRIKHSMLDG